MWAGGGNVTIVGRNLLVNSPTNYGGAVYVVDGTLLVNEKSRFRDNKAMVGGAFFYGSDNAGPHAFAAVCSITDAEFVSNRAAREEQESADELYDLEGGGAAMFLFAVCRANRFYFQRKLRTVFVCGFAWRAEYQLLRERVRVWSDFRFLHNIGRGHAANQ